VGRRMGPIKKKYLSGKARDVETIIRLRPWLEDECRNHYGDFKKTDLYTDYDAKENTFRFKLYFRQ
jgi:hypothetical protein